MPLAHQLRAVETAAEVAFNENASSMSSNTWTTQLPVEAASWEPVGERIQSPAMRQRLDEEDLPHIGAREWRLEFTVRTPGHLAASTGALAETWYQDLISDGLGGGNVAQVGGTINAGAQTATSLGITSGTAVVGAVLRVGAKGDARGDGQAAAVSAFSGGTATLLTALPAAPNAADVVYACQMAYHDESVVLTLPSKRFLIAHATSGAQWHLTGGVMESVKTTYPVGGFSMTTFRYRGAYWDEQSTTYPTTTTRGSAYCAPVGSGSFFYHTVGTATRQADVIGSMDVELNMALDPIPGVGAGGALGYITGFARTGIRPVLTFDAPWTGAWKTWWDTANASIGYRHFLFTALVDNGVAAHGFYCPRVMPAGPRPTIVEVNRQNYVRIVARAVSGATTTTELTRSPIRFFFG